MRLLLYARSDQKASQWLHGRIEAMVSREAREDCRDLDSLRRRLCRPRDGLSIAILVAATGEELLGILAMRDLLDDLRIILVLPDRSKETIAAGHQMAPRFLSYVDSDFEEVEAVLERMLQYGRNRRPNRLARIIENVSHPGTSACLA